MQAHAANTPPPDFRSHHARIRTLLHSCNTLLHLNQIHAHLLKSSLHLDPSFTARLISLYSSFDSISAARSVLNAVEGSRTYSFGML
ncbi:hypothetical protein ACLOJK_002731 [Asimina triloba]